MTAWDRRVALLVVVFAAYTIAAARQMGYMQGRIPGPGFAPFWIGVGLAAAALVILAGARGGHRGRATPGPVAPEPEIPQPATEEHASAARASGESAPAARVAAESTPIVIAAVTVAAVALIAPLGMLAALGLLLLVLARILGATWRTAAQTAVALPLALHVVFGVWLKVPMPRGPWGF